MRTLAPCDFRYFVALSFGGCNQRFGVVAPADFEHHLHTCFTHVQVDTFTHVFNFDQVGAVLGKHGEQSSQTTWSIADSGKHNQSAAAVGFVASHEPGQQPKVGIAALQHHAGGAALSRLNSPGNQR